MSKKPRALPVGAPEAMAVNHILNAIYGASRGAHEAGEGKRTAGAVEGFKQSLGPSLKGDAVILAASALGSSISDNSFSNKVKKRLAAATLLGLASKALPTEMAKFDWDKLKTKVDSKVLIKDAATAINTRDENQRKISTKNQLGAVAGGYLGGNILSHTVGDVGNTIHDLSEEASVSGASNFDKKLLDQAKSRGFKGQFVRGDGGKAESRLGNLVGDTGFFAEKSTVPTLSKYYPGLQEGKDLVFTPQKGSPATVAHELVHAVEPENAISRGLRNTYFSAPYRLATRLATPGAAIAGASTNEDISAYGPALAAAMHIPTLAEEGRANLVSYRNLKALGADDQVLNRALRGSVGSMMSYSAAPAASLAVGYGVRALRNRWSDKQNGNTA